MKDSIFNPAHQQDSVSSKIVVGLERISEVFKLLLWEHAKSIGLSPIQIQLLIFVAYHKQALCNVSHLAQEFNLTKPTISDAVKVLEKKGLILKNRSTTDSRSYSISLTDAGKACVAETEGFADPIRSQLETLGHDRLSPLYGALQELIFQLNQSGILQVQRTCYGCVFHSKQGEDHYCDLLKKQLLQAEIRLDCPEFQEKPGTRTP